MNGQCIPRTPIVVDYWNLGKVPPRCLFFLTHMHADHTSGLSSSWPHPIHCTAITGKLLVRKFKIDPKLVVELEIGESKILHVDRRGSHVTITVTTIDANHCPGSAMFLFEGYFGRILYTGDFRFSWSMLEDPILNGSRSIDVLYLDNTYCDPSCNFPTREEATRNLISLIEDKKDEYRVIVIGLHTLGKEDLLVQLATRLQQWVGVSNERMTTLKLLELPDVFTTDMSSCFIRVYPFYLIAKNRVAEMSSEDTLAVLPTCLYSGRGALPRPTGVVVVPYSDHSSFEELKSFVKAVRPRSIKPIVKNFSGDRSYISALRGDMSVFNDYLDPTPPHECHMPPGTEDLANSQVSYPSPLFSAIPIPSIQGSHSSSSGTNSTKLQFRSRSRGIRYLSPTKSKSPENLEIDNPSDQNSSQLDGSDNIQQHTIPNQDNSNKNGTTVTVDLASPCTSISGNIGRVPLIDLTASEQQQSLSEKSLQGVGSDQLIPQVEPECGPAPNQLKTDQNYKSNSNATRLCVLTQTRLDTFTYSKPTDGKSNTHASSTSSRVRAKNFTEKRRSLVTLEEPVTCARTVPIDSLRLTRDGHVKEVESRDDPAIKEGDRYQKAVQDIDDSGSIYKAEFVDRTATLVSVSNQESAQTFTRVREMTSESKICDEIKDACTSHSAVTFCKSMETERLASHLAAAQVTGVEIVDLTHLKDSQSPPNSPQTDVSCTTPCDLQNGSSVLQSNKNSIASTIIIAESNDLHSDQESNLKSADLASNLTPLPKLGASKATDAIYGRGPSQRSQIQISGGSSSKRKQTRLSFQNGPIDASAPSSPRSYGSQGSVNNPLQSPAAKRLRLSVEEGDGIAVQTPVVAKKKRVLPTFLQPGYTSEREHFGINYNHYRRSCYSRQQVEPSGGVCVCVCGSGETQRVPLCGQCHSSITQLDRSGLFSRLSKLDLNSPEVCQVIHDAIDSVVGRQQSNTAISQETSQLTCSCKDEEATKCFSGLEGYISDSHFQSSINSTDF